MDRVEVELFYQFLSLRERSPCIVCHGSEILALQFPCISTFQPFAFFPEVDMITTLCPSRSATTLFLLFSL